jgi:hypothetical protein
MARRRLLSDEQMAAFWAWAPAAIASDGVSSLNVPDVVHSEHFRVVTPLSVVGVTNLEVRPIWENAGTPKSTK